MKILLCGPYFQSNGQISLHNAEVGIYDALTELGHETHLWDYRHNKFLFHEGNAININNKSELPENDFDLTLCPGAGLSSEIQSCKAWQTTKNSLRILWSSEPIRLDNYKSKIKDNKDQFQVFCTFDETEIPLYKEIGIDAHFLPQGFNPSWYFPIRDANGKELPPSQRFPGHFVFIGSVGGKWENRVHFLNRVLAAKFRLNATTLFDATKVNQAYNMHDAVLNLGLYCTESGPPKDLKAFGLQQRIFEAVGAGKICITQETETDMFSDGFDVLYYNKNNLEEILTLALDRKYRKELEENILSIRDRHTYNARMKTLMTILGAK